MILGLDISTSITGATVIDTDGEVVYCESWDTRNKNKFPTLFEKSDLIKTKLANDIESQHQIKKIFVEQSLQSFRSGFSSAQTLSTLARINGIVSWISYKLFDIIPEYLSASSARKLCGLKIPRGSNTKEEVLKFVLDKYPIFDVQYTKFGNPKPGSYDRADSIIIAKAGYEKWKQIKEES